MELEIENLIKAIKAGIITPTTKDELEKAEAKRDRLFSVLNMGDERAVKLSDLVPRLRDHYRKLVVDLGRTVMPDATRAREVIKNLVGPTITLVPDSGHLVAEFHENYADMLKLTVGEISGVPRTRLIAY